MPLPGARYRVKTTSTGKKVRLAFKGNRVVETKSLPAGKGSKLGNKLADHIRKGKFKKQKK